MAVNLAITASAVAIDPNGTTDGWVKASEVTGVTARTRSDAYTWITSSVNRTGSKALQTLSASATPNATEVLSAYVAYLMYMDWVTRNVSVQDVSNQWTIFAGPADFDMSSVADLVDMGEQIRAKIIETGLLPSTTDLDACTWDASNAVHAALPTSADLSKDGGLAGIDTYYTSARAIITHYIDPHVALILNKYFGLAGSTDLATIKQGIEGKFPLEWHDQVISGNPPAEFVKVATACAEELRPYLAVYNELVHVYSTASSSVLASETFTATDGDHRVVGYVSNLFRPRADALGDYTTRALHSYIYNSKTTDDQNSTSVTVPENLFAGGAFTLMVQGKLTSKGVEWDDDSTKELTEIGYHVLAAGLTYVPFESKAGDEVFIATLESFLKNSDKMEDVTTILQDAINVKKPIYMTETKNAPWMDNVDLGAPDAAEYEYATLSDLLQLDQNVVRGYAVMTGKMSMSQVDSSSWEYAQGEGKLSAGASATANQPSPSQQDQQTAVQQAVEQMFSVGQSSITATDEQMSDFIAVSAGNSTKIMSVVTGGTVQSVGGLTSLIVHNASVNAKGASCLQSPEKQQLFINGLGDIVLVDGTVILPAIANPALYDYSNVGDMDSGDTIDEEKAKSVNGYYPYTAAFMNGYPNLTVGADGLAHASPGDAGKYAVIKDGNQLVGLRIYNVKKGKDAQLQYTDRVGLSMVNPVTLSISDDETLEQAGLTFSEGNLGNFRYMFSLRPELGLSQNTDNGNVFQRYMLAKSGARGIAQQYFPLVSADMDIIESYLSSARPLVTSSVRYISDPATNGSGGLVASGAFKVETYITEMVAQGMLGTQYASTLAKNLQIDYEAMVEDQYNRFAGFLLKWVSEAIDSIGAIDGVLAIKDGYENGFFNFIMNFLQEAYVLLVVVLLVILAVKFIRGRINAIYLLFIGALTFAAFNVYAVWMPTAVPAAYNFFVNDAVEDLVWNTVAVKAEDYDKVYTDSGMKDPVSGEPRPYTATITLYKLTQAELTAVSERTGESLQSIKEGSVIWLDEEAGIFLQGDQIKQSIDRLFVNNTMRGLYEEQWSMVHAGVEVTPIGEGLVKNPYIIKLTQPYVSLEAYYTPFPVFERAFLVNLNNFANIFSIERNYFSYGDELYKDAFLFNTFTNSGIFTAPGDDAALMANIRMDLTSGDLTLTTQDVIDKCNQTFYPQSDWMNLRSVFFEPSPAMKDSLWGQMMLSGEYYQDDWTMTLEQEERVWDLIMYINTQTKKFIIEHQEQLNYCSDENAIKLATLFATTAFTHKVSQFGYWLYPNYINASTIQLKDVLMASMTSLFDRNASINGRISNTVLQNIGVLGLVMVFVITVVSAVFIFVITYLVPVLYIMFGGILIWKLLNTDDSTGLIKGYFKVTGIIILLYFFYTLGIRLVGFSGYNWYGYFGAMIATLFLTYLLVHVLTAIFANPLELGNGMIGQRMFAAFDKLTGGRLGNLVANNFRINMPRFGASTNVTSRAYGRMSPMDVYNTGRQTRRGEHYGRWEDFDDANLSARARVIGRFGQVAAHADDVGRTRTGFRTTTLGAAARATTGAARSAVTNVRQTGQNIRSGVNRVTTRVRAAGDRFSNFGRRR